MSSLMRGALWKAAISLLLAVSLASLPALAKEPAAPPKARSAQRARATQSGLGERILAQARQMIAAFPTSSYNHKTNIDPTRGICEVDCSGFVATVLAAVSPEHLKAIPLRKAGRKRPLAEDFYAAFAAQQGSVPGWQAVTQVQDARPGDCIAWWKQEHKKGENTGHVMLIAEPPVLQQPGNWRIRILDSTASPHAADTRPEGKTGLGSGVIWLDVDANGRILGYHWKSATGRLNEHPVAIGRAIGRSEK